MLTVNEVRRFDNTSVQCVQCCACVRACCSADPQTHKHTQHAACWQLGKGAHTVVAVWAEALCCSAALLPACHWVQLVVVELPGGPPLLLRISAANTLTAEEQAEALSYHCYRCACIWRCCSVAC